MQNKKLSVVIIFLILLAGLTYFFGILGNKTQKVLQAYVPCGMIAPFKELAKAYESQHPKIKLQYNFDNTNVLLKLILHKDKRPEIFVSPGEKEISFLVEKGLVEKGSLKIFGGYKLILIAPANSKDINSLGDLTKQATKTIVIANPDFNSVGAYAVESLQSLGYWEKLRDKVLFTNTPIEALTLVATSKADAGIHYNSCPFETAPGKLSKGALRLVSELPSDSHSPIYNYIGILKGSQNKNIAYDFIEFMFSKKGDKILSQSGLEETKSHQVALSAEQPKVIIEAYYPFNEEHIFIKDYLLGLQSNYKGQIKVECIDFRTDEGYTRWRKTGLSCAGIFINGKNKFLIESNGKRKEVEFIKRPDISWTRQDLEAVIEKVLTKNN